MARALLSPRAMHHHHPRFEPPFCPNRDCPHHRNPRGFSWFRTGSYRRQAPPHRVQRFRCRSCGVYFSGQSYDVAYWMKRPELLPTLFLRLESCSAFRQIARELCIAHSTVARASARLGRHCQLFHLEHLPPLPPAEPLVVDGFQSFEFSQYFPCDFNLAVGSRSGFCYGLTESELRRSGTMRADQKRRRAQLEASLGRPDPRATERGIAELLADLLPVGARAQVRSDRHQDYPRAFRRLEGREIDHLAFSSRAARTPSNPLHPINDTDRLIRHSQANHKRETIAFSRRRQSAGERLFQLIAWKNYLKPANMAKQTPTPAQRLGLMEHPLSVEELLACRQFPERTGLSEAQRRWYERRVKTRALSRERRHELKYAF